MNLNKENNLHNSYKGKLIKVICGFIVVIFILIFGIIKVLFNIMCIFIEYYLGTIIFIIILQSY